MIKECVILAGGLGTRLRAEVPGLPKVMAPVAGKPFIHHIVSFLQTQGISRYIFSLGYMHEIVTQYVRSAFPDLEMVFSVEEVPLGTGGAIQLALHQAKTEQVFVVNGDTMYKADLNKVARFHGTSNALCTLTLKHMRDFDRYGVVEIDERGRVMTFKEKRYYSEGLINGGVYLIDKRAFLKLGLPERFSFEKDFLERYVHVHKFYGIADDNYFIDIGIPEDYKKANVDF